jgi:hypothetical protein
MEIPTSFDLNRAIQQWRSKLAVSPAFRHENLDELEAHLRDSIVALETKALSQEEAFVISARRIGKDALLEAEFQKVNGQLVLLDRALWGLLAIQCLFVAQQFSFIFIQLVEAGFILMCRVLVLDFGQQQHQVYLLAQSLSLPVLFLLSFVIARQVTARSAERIKNFFGNPLVHPARLALTLLSVSLLIELGTSWQVFTANLPAGVGGPWRFALRNLAFRLPNLVFLAALTFLIARKRLCVRRI